MQVINTTKKLGYGHFESQGSDYFCKEEGMLTFSRDGLGGRT